MIVRISGVGQYELDDDGVKRLDELDTALTAAYHNHDEAKFHECLRATVKYVQEKGKSLSDETLVGSDVIIPPDDTTFEEAKDFMTDEGLMAPLPA